MSVVIGFRIADWCGKSNHGVISFESWSKMAVGSSTSENLGKSRTSERGKPKIPAMAGRAICPPGVRDIDDAEIGNSAAGQGPSDPQTNDLI